MSYNNSDEISQNFARDWRRRKIAVVVHTLENDKYVWEQTATCYLEETTGGIFFVQLFV